MIEKIKTSKAYRIVLDILGLMMPLMMAIVSFVPIFFSQRITQFVQVLIVAFFLTMFLIKLLALVDRNKANEYDSVYEQNIFKARIMLIASIFFLLHIVVIFVAFMFVIFTQKDKGFFGSSIYLALFYIVIFIVRLIVNLVKRFSGYYDKDPYNKAMVYLEAITLLFTLVIGFNYIVSALDLEVFVLEIIVAIISILSMISICVTMFIEGIVIRHKNRRLMRQEIRKLKRNEKMYKKMEKLKKKTFKGEE